MHDHFLKGRRLFGSKVTNAKLNEDKVMEIRNLFKSGSNTATLGKMFGVGTGTILLIVKRKVWKHV